MYRQYHKWYSHSLHRDMELLVFGHAGPPMLVFPSSMGAFFEFEDRGMVSAVADKLSHGGLQLFCVSSVDKESWYNRRAHPRDRVVRYLQYERYILNEMSEGERDRFEEHYFDCRICAADVTDGARFFDSGRVMAGENGKARATRAHLPFTRSYYPLAAAALYEIATRQTACATPPIILNELFGAQLETPWTASNEQYRANVLALVRGLAARGARPMLLLSRPPYTKSESAAQWWRDVAEVADIVPETYFGARLLWKEGPILANRRMRTAMRNAIGRLTAVGVPTSRIGLVVGFFTKGTRGGREGLVQDENWFRIVKWHARAARQVAGETKIASVVSWGWAPYSQSARDLPDTPATACVYLWARDPGAGFCDGPAVAASQRAAGSRPGSPRDERTTRCLPLPRPGSGRRAVPRRGPDPAGELRRPGRDRPGELTSLPRGRDAGGPAADAGPAQPPGHVVAGHPGRPHLDHPGGDHAGQPRPRALHGLHLRPLVRQELGELVAVHRHALNVRRQVAGEADAGLQNAIGVLRVAVGVQLIEGEDVQAEGESSPQRIHPELPALFQERVEPPGES